MITRNVAQQCRVFDNIDCADFWICVILEFVVICDSDNYTTSKHHIHHDTPPSSLAAPAHSSDYIPAGVETNFSCLDGTSHSDINPDPVSDVRSVYYGELDK